MKIQCTHCLRNIQVPDSYRVRGRKAACPACDAPLALAPFQGHSAIAETSAVTRQDAQADASGSAADPQRTDPQRATDAQLIVHRAGPRRPIRWEWIAVCITLVVCTTAVSMAWMKPDSNTPAGATPAAGANASSSSLSEGEAELIELLKQEKQTLQRKSESLEQQLQKLRDQVRDLQSENEELQRKVAITDLWRRATFVVFSRRYAAGVQVKGPGDFTTVAASAYPDTSYVQQVARHLRIPVVYGNADLAEELATRANAAPDRHESLNLPVEASSAVALGSYWRVHKYVDPDPNEDATMVVFTDQATNASRVGFLLSSSPQGIEYQPVSRSTQQVSRSDIASGTARVGTAERLLVEPEVDFLDVSILQLAQQLESPEGTPGLLTLALRVKTDELEEALQLSKEMDKTWNDYYFDFMARINQEPYRPDARKEPARILRRMAEYLHDEIGSRLQRLGVPMVEREALADVESERALEGTADFEPRHDRGLDTASHMVVVDVDRPRNGGAFRVSMRLVETSSGQVLYENNGDIGRPAATVPERFFLQSGQLAFARSPQARTRSPRGVMAALNPERELAQAPFGRVVLLESAYYTEPRYRDLFARETYPLAAQLQTTPLGVADFQRLPTSECMRTITWQLSKAVLPAAGRVTSLQGERVLISIGSEAGVRQGDRFRVARYAAEFSEATRAKTLLPIQLRVDTISEYHSTCVMMTSGLDHLWEDPELRVDDLVLREGATSPSVLVSAPQPAEGLLSSQAAKQVKLLNAAQLQRLHATADRMSKQFHASLQQALKLAGVPCTTDVGQATHVISGGLAPVRGTPNDQSFSVQMNVYQREGNRKLATTLPVRFDLQDIEAWRP